MSANRMIATIFGSAFATVFLFVVIAMLSSEYRVVVLPVDTEVVASADETGFGASQ